MGLTPDCGYMITLIKHVRVIGITKYDLLKCKHINGFKISHQICAECTGLPIVHVFSCI